MQSGIRNTYSKVLFEHANLRLEYFEKGNYIHETWWGITPINVFIELLNEIIKYLEITESDGLLLDAREHRGLSPESQQIAIKTIGAFAKTVGKFREAIILPKDLLSSHSVKNYAQKVTHSGPVIVNLFDRIEKAELWLQTIK